MELHCGDTVYSFIEDSVLSDDSNSSNEFFDNLLRQNDFAAPESPSKHSISSLEADPLLSEAQLIDGQTLLDAFEIRIPQPEYAPKLVMPEPLLPFLNNGSSTSRTSRSFDHSKCFGEEPSFPRSPKLREIPVEALELTTDDSANESSASCSTNNNIEGDIEAASNENLNTDLCSTNNNQEVFYGYKGNELAIRETPSAILKSVGNHADTNMNLSNINCDVSQFNSKSEALLLNPPHIVEMNFKTRSASVVFRNAEGKQVLGTQLLQLPTSYINRRAKKLHKQVHKVLSVRQVQICKHFGYMLPLVQTNLGAKIYLCPVNCIRAYIYFVEAKIHALKHMKLKPYKCDEPNCVWEFYTPCKLARHRETHGQVKSFICDRCNRTFSTIYNLNEHRRKHNMPAILKCPIEGCDSMFQNEKQKLNHCYKTHKHSEAPFQCNLNRCTKSFFTESLLEAHARICSQRESEVACSYPNCGKIFNTPYRLREHMRQHTGVKPYHCKHENCTWRFTTASKLKRHQSIHTRDRKFHCTIGDCKKSFLRSEHLKDHTLTHIEKSSLEGKSPPVVQMRKNSEKKVECTKVHPEEEDLEQPGTSADALLEQAIQSLGSDMMSATSVPDTPIIFEDANVSTVNLRDLD